MKRYRFKADEVKSRLHETAYLNPKLTIAIMRIGGWRKQEQIVYHEPDGIVGLCQRPEFRNKEAVHDADLFQGTTWTGSTVEAAFQYVNELP